MKMKNLYQIFLVSQVLTIILSQNYLCSDGCGEHGICLNQKCLCDEGWLGTNCKIRVNQLQEGTFVNASVPEDSWEYFSYQISKKFCVKNLVN